VVLAKFSGAVFTAIIHAVMIYCKIICTCLTPRFLISGAIIYVTAVTEQWLIYILCNVVRY